MIFSIEIWFVKQESFLFYFEVLLFWIFYLNEIKVFQYDCPELRQ